MLPVWLLLAPRDYLSTFLKVGTMVLLALGILCVQPELKMPAVTRFIDGTGPVWSGSLFPFLFITIACGAVSGFHALISSGTTPKMLENEAQIPLIGYGGMLTESFVAIMALIGASVIDPGIYFAMNSPAGVIGTDAAQAAQVISGWGFTITPTMLTQLASDVGENDPAVTHRRRAHAGGRHGADPVAVFGGQTMMAIWYHFAILFEALFILTTVDAGTRVARFMIQDMIGTVVPSFRRTESWTNNLIGSALAVPRGATSSIRAWSIRWAASTRLWPLFGISNQMLAGIALILCTVVLFKMKRERSAWVTIVPTLWLLICTLTAGLQKLFHPAPASVSSPRPTLRRRGRGRQGAGPGEGHGGDEPHHLQRLRQCRAVGGVRRGRGGDDGLGVICIRKALGTSRRRRRSRRRNAGSKPCLHPDDEGMDRARRAAHGRHPRL